MNAPRKYKHLRTLLLLTALAFIYTLLPTPANARIQGPLLPINAEELKQRYDDQKLIELRLIQGPDLLGHIVSPDPNPLKVENCEIQGDVDLGKARIEEERLQTVEGLELDEKQLAHLKELEATHVLIIKKPIIVSQSIFKGNVYLKIFGSKNKIIVPIFENLVNFSGTHFSGAETSFFRAQFSGAETSFSFAQFSGERTFFSGAQFSGAETFFSDAQFSGAETSFSGAQFSGAETSFSGAQFSGESASFFRAQFSGAETSFSGAQFSGERTIFIKAQFSGERTIFIKAQFSGESASFFRAQFSGKNSDFISAQFGAKKIDFSESEFTQNVSFDNADWFAKETDFSTARFGTLKTVEKKSVTKPKNPPPESAPPEEKKSGAPESKEEKKSDKIKPELTTTVKFSPPPHRVSFENNEFHGKIAFTDAHFRPDTTISFKGSDFFSPVDFQRARFEGQEQNFKEAAFFSHADFSFATFGKNANLLNTTFTASYSAWTLLNPGFWLGNPNQLFGYRFDQTEFLDGKESVLNQANFWVHNQLFILWASIFGILIAWLVVRLLWYYRISKRRVETQTNFQQDKAYLIALLTFTGLFFLVLFHILVWNSLDPASIFVTPYAVIFLAFAVSFFQLKGYKEARDIHRQKNNDSQGDAAPSPLSSVFDPLFNLSRKRRDELRQRIGVSGALNCGIAGGRGMGKTQLARMVEEDAQKDPNNLLCGLNVPTEYQELEFLQTLFKTVAENIHDRLLGILKPADENLFKAREEARQTILGTEGVLLFLIVLSFSAIVSLNGWSFRSGWQVFSLAIPFVLLALPFVQMHKVLQADIRLKSNLSKACKKNRTGWKDLENKSSPAINLFLKNQGIREKLHFEISHSQGASAGLGGFGQKLGFSRSKQWKDRAMTLPDLTKEFGEYVQKDVLSVFNKVYIRLDELDKILDQEKARDFLNKLKGVFSIPDVVYLVTVSDEILKSYQTRNLKSKDAVDSTFDLVISMPPLSLAECFLFLARREFFWREEFKDAKGSSDPVQAGLMISVLSGGVPRDLLRGAVDYLLSMKESNGVDFLFAKRKEFLNNVMKSINTLPKLPDSIKNMVNTPLRTLLTSNSAPEAERIEKDAKKVFEVYETLPLKTAPPTPVIEAGNLVSRLGCQLLGLAALSQCNGTTGNLETYLAKMGKRIQKPKVHIIKATKELEKLIELNKKNKIRRFLKKIIPKWLKRKKKKSEDPAKYQEFIKKITWKDHSYWLNSNSYVPKNNLVQELEKLELIEILKDGFYSLADSPLETARRIEKEFEF